MKEIKAIIQPFMLEKVIKALHEIEGLPGCTVSTIQGYGRIGKSEGIEPNLGSSERTKLEIVIQDSLVDQVVDVIHKSAHTGNAGDGKIFVIEAVDAVSIRTGKRGEKAL